MLFNKNKYFKLKSTYLLAKEEEGKWEEEKDSHGGKKQNNPKLQAQRLEDRERESGGAQEEWGKNSDQTDPGRPPLLGKGHHFCSLASNTKTGDLILCSMNSLKLVIRLSHKQLPIFDYFRIIKPEF